MKPLTYPPLTDYQKEQIDRMYPGKGTLAIARTLQTAQWKVKKHLRESGTLKEGRMRVMDDGKLEIIKANTSLPVHKLAKIAGISSGLAHHYKKKFEQQDEALFSWEAHGNLFNYYKES